MISYKIISQEHYENLAKLSADFPSQRSLLIQANTHFIQKINQFRDQTTAIEYQLQTEKQKNDQLCSQKAHFQSQLLMMSQSLMIQIEKGKKMTEEINETSNSLKKVLDEKAIALNQNKSLLLTIKTLQIAIIALNQKQAQAQQKQKLLQSKITSLELSLKHQNKQKLSLFSQNQEKDKIIQNLNAKLNYKSDLLEKIVSQYEACKQEKLTLETQIKKYQNSPIPKLQQKIHANQIWIAQLTQSINQLRQRCIQLQMDRPQPASFKQSFLQPFKYASKTPYPKRQSPLFSPRSMVPYTPKFPVHKQNNQGPSAPQQKISHAPQTMEQTFLVNRSRIEQSQRLRYLTICKQLVQQFNSKLSKIQQQKKSMQQKYQSLRLKLNEYQYNQFKYKDKICLYLQKIQRYEKLTEKQQSQMQNLIMEFDQEMNNIVRTKEEEIRTKLQQQISKYQIELQKLKEQEELTKKLQQQAYQQLINHEACIDDFDFEMMKQSLLQAEEEIVQKNTQLSKIKKQLAKTLKQLDKYKESKQSYKQKAIQLQADCYQNSTQIRRLKGLLQQLCQQLESKSNQNQILRSNLKFNLNHHTNRSDENSRLKQDNSFNQNFSGKLYPHNNVRGAKKSGSERFQYQFSQIDSEIQKRNQNLLNNILLRKLPQYNQEEINSPGIPSKRSQHSHQIPKNEHYWTKVSKGSINDSLEQKNRSQLSSQSENESWKEKDGNSGKSSPNNSTSSKNSYQSYGIKNLYKQKSGIAQGHGQRYLLHKNSLQ